MKPSRLTARIAAIAASMMMFALVGGMPVSAAPAATAKDTAPTWTLVDLRQRICASPNDPRTLYYYVAIEGTWSAQITASYTGLPSGTEIFTPPPAQPGSGDGHHVQIWAAFRLHGAALGHYVPKIWVTDGTVTQSVPVVLDISSSC